MLVEERSVVVHGLEVALRIWGDDKGVPILALHGWLDNANTFTDLAPLLGGFRVYAMDFVGHGYSDHRAGNTTLHFIDNVRDVIAVADALGLGDFVLLGHSMGAGVSTLVASAFPERIKAMVLIDGFGPMVADVSGASVSLAKSITKMKSLEDKTKPLYETFEQGVKARLKGIGNIDESASRILCERGLKEVDGGYTWRTDSRLTVSTALWMTEEQVLSFIKAIVAPTLFIWAEQGFAPIMPALDGRIKAHKDVKVEKLTGGHHLHLHKEAIQVAECTNKFLNPFLV